ncbi:hypothetical protein [Arthrobacter sp. SO3]|uniref:hypothetical protein n=1 Tax=Arthrobacter sp. SO3 TaxID=1897057 RepID=UPI001CFF9B37|nr:hypothetical protein [Arthrobacter sp. SO3]MCB5292445.1 hypothetical protein [Arthrobacter sp. SO3]
MNENLTNRPKLSGGLAASLRRRSASTTAVATRSLPSIPISHPVTPPASQTPSVPRATATATSSARSLPAIPVRKTLPVITEKQPVPAPINQVKEPKVSANRSAAAKKRNRGSVITPRDKELLRFLGKVNVATALLISGALTNFFYKDVRTGELKPASADGIKARLTVLRKAGLVEYKNNRAGVTVWFLTWDGYEAIDKPYPDNRPRHQRITTPPKPQKARAAPKESKWAHTLGLAALIIHFKNDGYQFITDDEMLAASEEMRALDKTSNGYVGDNAIRKDLSFKETDQFRDHTDHFNFPNENGGSHRPDLVVTKPGEGVIAVELELNRKNIKDKKAIVVGYANALACGRFDSVVYVTDPKVEAFERRYLKEFVGPETSYRRFYEQFAIQTYNAAEWDAAVPEL